MDFLLKERQFLDDSKDVEVTDIAVGLIGALAQQVSLEVQTELVAQNQEQQVALLDAIMEAVVPVSYSKDGVGSGSVPGAALNIKA